MSNASFERCSRLKTVWQFVPATNTGTRTRRPLLMRLVDIFLFAARFGRNSHEYSINAHAARRRICLWTFLVFGKKRNGWKIKRKTTRVLCKSVRIIAKRILSLVNPSLVYVKSPVDRGPTPPPGSPPVSSPHCADKFLFDNNLPRTVYIMHETSG